MWSLRGENGEKVGENHVQSAAVEVDEKFREVVVFLYVWERGWYLWDGSIGGEVWVVPLKVNVRKRWGNGGGRSVDRHPPSLQYGAIAGD